MSNEKRIDINLGRVEARYDPQTELLDIEMSPVHSEGIQYNFHLTLSATQVRQMFALLPLLDPETVH